MTNLIFIDSLRKDGAMKQINKLIKDGYVLVKFDIVQSYYISALLTLKPESVQLQTKNI